MKVNELMDNDLFMYGGNLCRFVIRSTDAIVQRLSDKSEYQPCAVFNAEPIPLTAIMLANNGMREDKWNEGDIQRCGGIAYREFHANEKFFYVRGHGENPVEWKVYNNGQVTVKYVHELQHALRLCGLIDLADNFKI